MFIAFRQLDVLNVCFSEMQKNRRNNFQKKDLFCQRKLKITDEVFKEFEFYAILSSLITFASYSGGLLSLLVIKPWFYLFSVNTN